MARIAGVSPDETKARLIDAAAKVFEEKGFEGSTVIEIAREAGVSSGAIYAHYKSKSELLVAAMSVHGRRATAALFPDGARVDARTVLSVLADHLARGDRADVALLQEAVSASRRDPELAQVLSAAIAQRERDLHQLIEEGQKTGSLRSDVSPELAARFSLMLGLGSMIVTGLDLPPIDQDEWSRFTRGLVGTMAQQST